MKLKIAFSSVVIFFLLFSSCTTDFDVVAPYKETMVIYGLLNPTEKTQYIRISKAFLGEGNSLIMAQERDSIHYADILDVKLKRIKNGAVIQTISLQRETTIPKNGGVFHYPYQVLYSTTDSIRADSKYRIEVYNTQTGLTCSGETKIVGHFNGDTPADHLPNVTPSFDFTPAGIYEADFYPAPNGYVYNMTIRFHYKDVNLVSHDTTSRFVDWNFGDQVVGTNQSRKISYSLYRPDLYRIVGGNIPLVDTSLIERRFGSPPIEFMFTAGTEDLYTYQQLVQPSDGIVQERPLFSNIENGIGLITSRYVKSSFFNFNGLARSAFDTSRYTRNLHFH